MSSAWIFLKTKNYDNFRYQDFHPPVPLTGQKLNHITAVVTTLSNHLRVDLALRLNFLIKQ
jgi:hypothetical protein